MRYLTEPAQQRVFAHNNFEFAADPDVAPAEEIAQFGTLQARPDRREGRRRAPRGRAPADGGGGVGLIPTRRRPDGATVLTVVCAVLIAGPLVGLPLSFIVAPGALSKYSGFLPEAIEATAILLVGVGIGTLVLGTSLAALVSFCDFPGRSWIEWILVLPLAMPGYVFTLFALGLDVPGVRSTVGAVCIFTLVLYPYVYLLARASFLSQSRTLLEAARGLGMSRGRAIVRVGAAARAAGDPRRRGAGADGGAGRLRHREPARRAHVHRRDLPRLVQRLRPRGRDAVRDAARVGDAAAAPARAPGARARALPPQRRRAATCCRRSACAARRPWPRWSARSRSWAGRGGAAGAARRLVGPVDPGRAARPRVRHGHPQQPAAVGR